MIMKSENLSRGKQSQPGVLASTGGGRKTISPAERWLLITEKAYCRVQKRGFVGGDPFVDWAEAEREVDAVFDTDDKQVFMRADAEKLSEQVKRIFGGYGLGHLSLETILQTHREGLERLTDYNRRLMESTSALASQQTVLFQDAVNEAMDTLQSFTQGKVDTDGFARQAELSTQAMENILSYFKDLTESVASISPVRKKHDSST